MFRKTWFAVCVLTLSPLGMFVPRAVLAQHGRGRHGGDPGPQEHPAYETNTEARFRGTVADVKTGASALDGVVAVHTLGRRRTRAQEKRLLLKTDAGTVDIQLGPTAFLNAKKVEIKKGDTLEVTGSRVTIGESHVILAREIRKGANVWALRDATGRPLWSSARTQARGFWTTKRVLLAVVVIKVVALATVLRH
jgi:hypothetical protein